MHRSERHLKIEPRPTTQCVTDPAATCCKCDRLPYVVAKLETEEEESRRRRSKCVFLWDHQQIQITLPATKLTNAQPHADQVAVHSSRIYMPGDWPARLFFFSSSRSLRHQVAPRARTRRTRMKRKPDGGCPIHAQLSSLNH